MQEVHAESGSKKEEIKKQTCFEVYLQRALYVYKKADPTQNVQLRYQFAKLTLDDMDQLDRAIPYVLWSPPIADFKWKPMDGWSELTPCSQVRHTVTEVDREGTDEWLLRAQRELWSEKDAAPTEQIQEEDVKEPLVTISPKLRLRERIAAFLMRCASLIWQPSDQ